VNNHLAVAVGTLELLQEHPDGPAALRDLMGEAAAQLYLASGDIAKLHQVVRVATRQTPVGLALDLDSSLVAVGSHEEQRLHAPS
jgi:hypothetical protein